MKDKRICTNQGGSPLVCSIPQQPNRFYQVGIVPGKVNCTEKNVPSVLADISKYRDWIDHQFRDLGIDSDSFVYENQPEF